VREDVGREEDPRDSRPPPEEGEVGGLVFEIEDVAADRRREDVEVKPARDDVLGVDLSDDFEVVV